jgi:hypothetical protein
MSHGLSGHKPRSFPPNRAPKIESQKLFSGLRLVSKEFHHIAIQTKIEENFGGFFRQIKVRLPIGRKYSKQTVIPPSRRLGSFCMKRLRTLISFQIFKIKIKKIKNIVAVDVLFKVYPMIPLSG